MKTLALLIAVLFLAGTLTACNEEPASADNGASSTPPASSSSPASDSTMPAPKSDGAKAPSSGAGGG